MVSRLTLGDLEVDVRFKNIQNVHLSVHPPTGRVSISAPSRLSMDAVRAFAASRVVWIRQQQRKLQVQERETPREYLDRESHYVWGKRYLLAIHEGEHAPSIELEHSRLVLRVRPGADEQKREAVLEQWYRRQMRESVLPLLARWEPILNVHVERFFVQRMKTRWGTCNHKARTIRLNTDLAKKPRECLEYILVHELAHLIEPTHNARFVVLMDHTMPDWQFRRDVLNRLPVRGENWKY
jgi:predicted metal-dependent hydrolase